MQYVSLKSIVLKFEINVWRVGIDSVGKPTVPSVNGSNLLANQRSNGSNARDTITTNNRTYMS